MNGRAALNPPPAAAQGKAGPAPEQHRRPNPVGGGMGELTLCEYGRSLPITYLSCGGMGWKEMLFTILPSPNPLTPIHPSTQTDGRVGPEIMKRGRAVPVSHQLQHLGE